MIFRKLKTILFICIFSSTVFAGQGISNMPESYEEACDLSYDLIQKNQEEALKVIKYIYKRNLPVKESDVSFVNSIAALALRPIFREYEISKELFKKVVNTKKNDFTSNRILMAFAAMGNDSEGVKRHAYNLLNADYNSYIKSMAPAANSSLTQIRSYLDGIIDTYNNIANFFLENGDKVNWKRATNIVEDIKMNKQ